MEKESHEENNNHTTIVSGEVITKRKPGRPRKHHNKLDSTEQSSSRRSIEDDHQATMVGQQVTGVIEATFEAGFLLSVKLGNSDTVLRGVVFRPGRCEPVSVDNDIAPHVPMIGRNSDVVQQQQQQHRHGLPAKRGRKSRFREKRGGGDRASALAPVPILPNHHPLVPVVQNDSGSVPTIESQVSGGSNNGKPFETLLTQVMKEGQVHNTTPQFTEHESEEQALSIEPLQAIHPVHPVHIPKPVPSYGRGGKMTELLQAVQENVRETHYSQGQ